jgi:hypothetical protein
LMTQVPRPRTASSTAKAAIKFRSRHEGDAGTDCQDPARVGSAFVLSSATRTSAPTFWPAGG